MTALFIDFTQYLIIITDNTTINISKHPGYRDIRHLRKENIRNIMLFTVHNFPTVNISMYNWILFVEDLNYSYVYGMVNNDAFFIVINKKYSCLLKCIIYMFWTSKLSLPWHNCRESNSLHHLEYISRKSALNKLENIIILLDLLKIRMKIMNDGFELMKNLWPLETCLSDSMELSL